jgi:hypothetical protein
MLPVAFLLALAVPAGTAMQADADPLITRLAADLQAAAGQRMGTMLLRSARGEARTLVMELEMTDETPALIGPAQVASLTAANICSRPQGGIFFSNGRGLRVDLIRAGRAVGSARTDRCPGPIGEGMSAATFAAGLQSFVGMEADGIRISGVRAEGRAVIFTIDTSAALRDGVPDNFVLGFCLRPEVKDIFFANGLVLRVDTTVGGADLRAGPPVTACPGS